jgi:hypothetical protein
MVGWRARGVVLSAAMTLLLGACGPTPSPTPSGSTGTPSTTEPSPSVSAPPVAPTSVPSTPASAAPTATPPPASAGPTPSAGSGDLSADLCTKLTTDEVAAATGAGSLTTRPEPGDAQTGACSYLAGDRAVAATMYLASGGKLGMDAMASQSEPVAGLGDAAIWVPATSALYIRKGDAVVRIQLLPSIIAPEEIKATTVALGTILAGRF